MKRFVQAGLSVLLILALVLSLTPGALAAVDDKTLDDAIKDTAEYIYRTVNDPQVGSVGGEWAVLGLARSGYEVPPAYYQNYYATVEAYVEACKGLLHDKKYTEYSRLIVALTSIGKDPRNVAGYNLLTPLGDYEKTIWQGLNGPIWALIALDSGNYEMPQNSAAETQATREMYINRILECQLKDGGFSLLGGSPAASSRNNVSDPDITGMALQALAKYQDRQDVKQVTAEALACLSNLQQDSGGFASWSSANSESVVQVIVALTELGIPLDDPRFVKNGNTLLDSLMSFYVPGNGFFHTAEGSGSNLMASEQGLYGLVAAQRARAGKSSLYRMSDAPALPDAQDNGPGPGQGLAGKHADIKAQPIIEPGKTFEDITAHKNRPAIEALAARGIISGKSDTQFDPEATMTRAEFAAIVVRGLGLTPQANSRFTDVRVNSWYAPYVGTAYEYGIVSGTSDTAFDPAGTITRQEAATMVSRAAKLCGMDTAMDTLAVRDLLAQFSDYVQTAEWARQSLAFCYQEDILEQSELEILPQEPIKRCELAQMLFNLLGRANLLQEGRS